MGKGQISEPSAVITPVDGGRLASSSLVNVIDASLS